MSSPSDDAMAKAKADERRARLGQMMVNDESSSANASHASSTPDDYIPRMSTALSNLEREVLGQQGGTGEKKPRSGTAMAAIPGSVTQMRINTQATNGNEPNHHQTVLSAQERDLLSKTSGGSSTNNDTKAAAVEKKIAAGSSSAAMSQQLSAQELDLRAKAAAAGSVGRVSGATHDNAAADKATSMGQMLHRLMAGSTTNVPVPSQLQHHEINALTKQRLPRESMTTNDGTPSKDLDRQDSITYEASSSEQVDYFASSTAAITAEIVDEAGEREKIAKEAQEAIISNAVVATKVDENEERNRSRRWWGLVVCLVVILPAIVLAGVCGSGKCSKGPSAAARAKALTEFIASVSLQDLKSKGPLVYPHRGDTNTRSPEQQALDHLIEDDALKLSVVAQGDRTANWRLVQRYALLVVWFTNGPWKEPTPTDLNVVPSAAASWLVGSNECGWSGIDCDQGRVVQLDLSDRQLTGTVPKDMGLLTDVVGLRLPFNILGGPLEDTIAIVNGMGPLVTLDLSFNNFTGTLPEELASFGALRSLDLGSNKITGTLPEWVATMTTLESLTLNFNHELNGTIPTSLAALTSLTTLGLGSCTLSSSTPFVFLNEMKDLTSLDLGSTTIIGEPPSLVHLSGLSKLTHLDHSGMVLQQGTIPSEVADWWPDMSSFNLGKSNVTGTIPSSLAQWTRLKYIYLSENQLSSTIPLSFYAAWSDTLEVFSLGSNRLTGRLSSELGLWSNLAFFDIKYNELTGSIPTTIGLLTNLKQVDLNGNRLTGSIPSEVLQLRQSLLVRYNDNNLTGAAPYCVNETLKVADQVDCAEVYCPCCSGCNY